MKLSHYDVLHLLMLNGMEGSDHLICVGAREIPNKTKNEPNQKKKTCIVPVHAIYNCNKKMFKNCTI